MTEDYYAGRQAGGNDDIGLGEYKTCKKYATAVWKNMEATGNTAGYTKESLLAQTDIVSGCRPNDDESGTYLGMRCGASFTSSSMAALFGLLCVSLALW